MMIQKQRSENWKQEGSSGSDAEVLDASTLNVNKTPSRPRECSISSVISGLPFVSLLQSEGEKEKAELPSGEERRRVWQYANALKLDANPWKS
jgi:hypothetical protein